MYGCCSFRGSRGSCQSSGMPRRRLTPIQAHCSRHNRKSPLRSRRQKCWRGNPKRGAPPLLFLAPPLEAPLCRASAKSVNGLCPAPLLFLHAANGETHRTAVAILGIHDGIGEAQVRPVHARRRVRRTAPGVTARAHIEQVAGIAGAVTRSGVGRVALQVFMKRPKRWKRPTQ